MGPGGIRYDKIVDSAFRGVVRDILTGVARDGLPGDHHFYLSFRTDHRGVEIPDGLRSQYPAEMTIVLQHQFFGLKVDNTGFSVTLSFNGQRERIAVPFAALTTFADPSVNFALQFQVMDASEATAEATTPAAAPAAEPPAPATGSEAETEAKRGQVVTLDAFRKR